MEQQNNDNEIIGEELTLKQEAFCRNYTQNEEFYGNATLSYADAYGYDLESMTKEDGVYQLKDGTTIFGKMALDQVDPVKTIGVKLIEKSTYDRNYDHCSSLASRLRRNVKIQERCRVLLNEMMDNKFVDARLIEIILKGEDKDSIQAIKEYNSLKQRIIKKTDLTTDGKPIIMLTPELAAKNGITSNSEANSDRPA